MLKLVLSRTLVGAAVTLGLAAGGAPGYVASALASDRPSSPPIVYEADDSEIAPPGSDEEAAGNRPYREADDGGTDTGEGVAEAPQPAVPARAPKAAPASNKGNGARGDLGRLLSVPDKKAPSPMLENRGADFYDRRAEELLKKDNARGTVEQHPLMEAHPDSYVVVCTAGCPSGEAAAIVGMLPKAPPAPVSVPETAEGPAVISCVGGCPSGGTGAFVGTPSPAAGGAAVAATVGEWLTTVARVPDGASEPLPRPATGSGAWMENINRERATVANPAADAAPTPAPASPVKAEEKTDSKPASATVAAPKPVAPAAPAPATQVTVEAKPDSKPAVAAVAAPKPVAPAAPAPATQVTVEAKPDSKPAVVAVAAPKPVAPAVPAPAAPVVAESKPDAKTVVAAVETPAARPSARAPAAPSREPTATSDEKVISVLSEDKEMNAAIKKARGSLATFWSSYDAPAANETDHALKVAISADGNTEHFWLTRIKRDGDKLSGLISNQPQNVKTVRMGQRYEFAPEMISDWTFKRNGKLVGNETMRVLLPRMPEEQAAAYRQMYETP